VQWYGGGHRTRQLGLMRLSCSTVSENIMRRRRGNACTGSGGFGGLAAVDGAGAWRRGRRARSVAQNFSHLEITSQPAGG